MFEKDQYWKQILDNSPFATKNVGPDGQYMKACQIRESGTLRGLEKQRVESATPFGDVTETWRGPCYVEVQFNDESKVIWGKKLTKVEHAIMHSVHVTIE